MAVRVIEHLPVFSPIAGYKFKVAYIEITRKCNLRCAHCYHRDNRDDQAVMSLKDYQTLMMNLAHKHQVDHFVILGGEPVLHPEVAEMIKFSSLFGGVDICTNGKDVKRLLSVVKQIRKYRVSLDGLSDTHDGIRGRGSFDQACLSLKRMINAGCAGSVTTTVHRDNQEEIIALAGKMNKLGVKDMQIQQLMNFERTEGLTPLTEREVSIMENRFNDLRDRLNINIIFQKEKPISREGNVINRLTVGPRGDVTFSPNNLGSQKYIVRFDFELSEFVLDIDKLIRQT